MARVVQRFVDSLISSEPTDDCIPWPFSTLSGAKERPGGRYAKLWNPALKRMDSASRVLWERMHGPIPAGLHTRHLCGNGHLGCVNPRHLALGTRTENMRDKIGHGTMPFGSRMPHAKLTEQQVVAACERIAAGESARAVAAAFGVSPSTLGGIWRGETWRHVSGAPRSPASRNRRSAA